MAKNKFINPATKVIKLIFGLFFISLAISLIYFFVSGFVHLLLIKFITQSSFSATEILRPISIFSAIQALELAMVFTATILFIFSKSIQTNNVFTVRNIIQELKKFLFYTFITTTLIIVIFFRITASENNFEILIQVFILFKYFFIIGLPIFWLIMGVIIYKKYEKKFDDKNITNNIQMEETIFGNDNV